MAEGQAQQPGWEGREGAGYRVVAAGSTDQLVSTHGDVGPSHSCAILACKNSKKSPTDLG